MSGTREGGIKAAQTNKVRYGETFYITLGRAGGSAKTDKPKGFAADPERARTAVAKGGQTSKRRPKTTNPLIEGPFENRPFWKFW